jgi:hypothetical protein
LVAPVDLSERSVIRLSVDGGAPVEVDIAGAAPSSTSLDEIVTRINAVFPNLASATDDDRLRLTSPSRGENSHLELQPLRVLELIDYPPTPLADPPAEAENPARVILPGDKWSVVNDGAADASIEVELSAPHGVFGPQVVNYAMGQRVRILEVVRPGERLKLRCDDESGLECELIDADDHARQVDHSKIQVLPIGPQVTVDSQPIDTTLAAVLTLPRGRSDWSYMECYSSRFDCARFNAATFAGGRCTERGIFDVSRFKEKSLELAVFSSRSPFSDPPVEIRFSWQSHRPGAFVVNLPADLPERFGGRFNQARFAHAGEKPDEGEQFHGVVTEPKSDPDYLQTRINTGPNPSKLVRAGADVVGRVPIGFEAATMPFRKPRSLTLGTETQPAKIYLAEKDVSGFIELSARSAGSWGNSIQVVARKAGPALFDVTIKFAGARFENARLVAMGGEHLPASVEEMLKPGPMGILQAKAAGIRASVTRDGVEAIT